MAVVPVVEPVVVPVVASCLLVSSGAFPRKSVESFFGWTFSFMPSIPLRDHALTVKLLKSASYNNRAKAASFASKDTVFP